MKNKADDGTISQIPALKGRFLEIEKEIQRLRKKQVEIGNQIQSTLESARRQGYTEKDIESVWREQK